MYHTSYTFNGLYLWHLHKPVHNKYSRELSLSSRINPFRWKTQPNYCYSFQHSRIRYYHLIRIEPVWNDGRSYVTVNKLFLKFCSRQVVAHVHWCAHPDKRFPCRYSEFRFLCVGFNRVFAFTVLTKNNAQYLLFY